MGGLEIKLRKSPRSRIKNQRSEKKKSKKQKIREKRYFKNNSPKQQQKKSLKGQSKNP